MPGLSALVIGYGNEIRGDDGVGPHVANLVEAWSLPGVRCCMVHQLTPELAALAADASLAIFIDACPAVEGQGVRVHPVHPEPEKSGVGHTASPRTLLDLAKSVYGHCPEAYLVTIPGSDFGFATELSPAAKQGADDALPMIRQLLEKKTLRE